MSIKTVTDVAPRVGAWIETTTGATWISAGEKSHPVWVRGLKLICLSAVHFFAGSHPVWVRGLKHDIWKQRKLLRRVAPRVGAWIETVGAFVNQSNLDSSHPVWVRGLKRKIRA